MSHKASIEYMELVCRRNEKLGTHDAEFLEETDGLFGCAPCRCRPAFGLLARKGLQDIDRFGKHVALLLLAQRADEFVRVSMQTTISHQMIEL
jgi:hypothetical protein